MSLALKEAHTNAEDRLVNYETSPDPGIPLLWVGGWGRDTHFGAGLTPLPDKTRKAGFQLYQGLKTKMRSRDGCLD